MKKYLLAFIIYWMACFPAFGDTSLWKVTRDGSVTYLAGTCHVLRPSDYPLPRAFEIAYGDSAVIAFETDLTKINNPAVLNVMVQEGMYRNGLSLEKTLSANAYRALKTYCKGVGVPMEAVSRMKPWMALLSLLNLELQKLGVDEGGVDAYFHQKAMADGKAIEALEPVEKHMEVISMMGKGYENDFVLFSLRDLKKSRQIVEELISIWKRGDEERLKQLFADQMKRECPALYELILVKRNRKWLGKITHYLQTPEKELVLVGVAHLVGEDGLITLLKKRGYQIEKW